MTFTLPADTDQRPVAIDRAGTLGQRIATVFAAGGSSVRIFDLSKEQREAAVDYVTEDIDRMWEIFTRPGIPPFELMDRVGL
jgi:3-hydroxybutyryl-CoA dehydrogenase